MPKLRHACFAATACYGEPIYRMSVDRGTKRTLAGQSDSRTRSGRERCPGQRRGRCPADSDGPERPNLANVPCTTNRINPYRGLPRTLVAPVAWPAGATNIAGEDGQSLRASSQPRTGLPPSSRTRTGCAAFIVSAASTAHGGSMAGTETMWDAQALHGGKASPARRAGDVDGDQYCGGRG